MSCLTAALGDIDLANAASLLSSMSVLVAVGHARRKRPAFGPSGGHGKSTSVIASRRRSVQVVSGLQSTRCDGRDNLERASPTTYKPAVH
jgi:hypothetical protein